MDYSEAMQRLLRAVIRQAVWDGNSRIVSLASDATEFLTSRAGRLMRQAAYEDDEFIAMCRSIRKWSTSNNERWYSDE